MQLTGNVYIFVIFQLAHSKISVIAHPSSTARRHSLRSSVMIKRDLLVIILRRRISSTHLHPYRNCRACRCGPAARRNTRWRRPQSTNRSYYVRRTQEGRAGRVERGAAAASPAAARRPRPRVLQRVQRCVHTLRDARRESSAAILTRMPISLANTSRRRSLRLRSTPAGAHASAIVPRRLGNAQ